MECVNIYYDEGDYGRTALLTICPLLRTDEEECQTNNKIIGDNSLNVDRLNERGHGQLLLLL